MSATATNAPEKLILTDDQQNALEAFNTFLMDPIDTVFVLKGYSGCGKSTLVRHLLECLPKTMKLMKLIDPHRIEYEPTLTATTNKAAENLSNITGQPAITIHSFLGLRVSTDFRTNVTTLIPKSAAQKENHLLFIDEASYIDSNLLSFIFKLTKNCKVVFIGDPAQLTPIKTITAPVFDANFSGAELKQVVRQAEGNPIVELSTMFRNTVNTGEFTAFKPDGTHIQRMSRNDFNQAVSDEFTRPDWRYQDSKVLGWTNKCAINYNHYVRNLAKGDPHFQVDDYAICNAYLQAGKMAIKTDQMVQITEISDPCEEYGVPGNFITMDHFIKAFQPKTLESKNARIKKARADGDIHIISSIETSWVDLRAAYACTINKSQGSTYEKVYIDLDDISNCNSGDQIARMMYVGVSRARTRVYLTGDLA